MIEFFKKKSIGFYFVVAAIVTAIVAFICVLVAGGEVGDLTAGIVVLFVLGILVAGVAVWKDFYAVPLVVASVLLGVGISLMFVPRLEMIGMIVLGLMPGKQLSAAFITAMVFTVLSMALLCVPAFMGTEKKED